MQSINTSDQSERAMRVSRGRRHGRRLPSAGPLFRSLRLLGLRPVALRASAFGVLLPSAFGLRRRACASGCALRRALTC